MGSDDSSTECHPGRDGQHCPEHDPCCYCGKERSPGERAYHLPCRCGHVQGHHKPSTEGGCVAYSCDCDGFKLAPEEPEPPMSSEEEEQAPMDEAVTTDEYGHRSDCPGCAGPNCGPPEDIPPQPDRRPPFAVTYSVQGHLYEVALPGDATVRAVDGALVIQHALGPVAGIVQVLPVINEEQT